MTNDDLNNMEENKHTNEEESLNADTDASENSEIQPDKENPINPANVESGEVLGTNRTEEEYKRAMEAVSKEISECNKLIEQTRDWKDIRIRLNDTKDKLKSLFLEKEDDERLLEQINELFNKLNEKQKAEQEKFNEESDDNYEKLKSLVDEAIKTAHEADNFRDARNGLVKVQQNFRGVKLRRSQRDELLDDINKAFEVLQQRQAEERENFEMECIENYHSLKKIIDDAVNFSKDTTQFGKARKNLIDAQSQIKGKKLKRNQRDELYQTIRDAFNDLNERQEADRELFDKETKMNYENLKKIVDEAIAFASEATDFKQAREALINAQGTIKGMKLKRSQRDELYADIRKVFNNINETQEEERKEFDAEANANYKRLTEKIDDAFDLVHGVDDLRLIRETLIAIQGEIKIVKLKRAQRNELFARIREAFGIFDKKKEDFFGKKKQDKPSENSKDSDAGKAEDAADKKTEESAEEKHEEVSETKTEESPEENITQEDNLPDNIEKAEEELETWKRELVKLNTEFNEMSEDNPNYEETKQGVRVLTENIEKKQNAIQEIKNKSDSEEEKEPEKGSTEESSSEDDES